MNSTMQDIVPLDKRSAGVKDIAPWLRPQLPVLYAHREERLRELAVGHADAAYLHFVADLVRRQRELLVQQPLVRPARVQGDPLGSVRSGLDDPAVQAYWIEALRQLVSSALVDAPHVLRDALEPLRQADDPTLKAIALDLREGRFEAVDAANALFVWTALSLTAAQYADFVVVEGEFPLMASEHTHCPFCGCAPAGSLIMTGDRAGLRYLQCALCETRWHLVRAKCSNCGESGALDHWALDDVKAPVKAESCGDCGSYLKAFYAEHDAEVEVCADDLASLQLDAAVADQGYARTGVSPFAFQVG